MPQPDESVVAAKNGWTVHECPHGCLHVRLDNLTLTFSPERFRRLVELLGEAYVRLCVRDTVRMVEPH